MNKTVPWIISTVMLAFACLFLLLFLPVSNYSFSQNKTSDIEEYASTDDESDTQVFSYSPEPESIKYPGSAFFLNSGTATVGPLIGTSLENQSFILTLHPYGENAKPKSYTIPIANVDMVVEPRISYNENFACVQVGISGYSGYYIFSLPGGEKVAQGEQYSNCVEWISEYQVIVAEQPYGSGNSMYSILDARTQQKQVISSFSNESIR